MHMPFGGMAFLPLVRLAHSASLPVLMRGAQAALSPSFGAPATPAPWQAAQAVLYTCSPVRGPVLATTAGAGFGMSSPSTYTLPTGAVRSRWDASERQLLLSWPAVAAWNETPISTAAAAATAIWRSKFIAQPLSEQESPAPAGVTAAKYSGSPCPDEGFSSALVRNKDQSWPLI